MSGTDIFISYSRADRSAARHFADSFVGEGFSVWWDAALRSGQTFDEVIEQELRAAKAVVVLWSPRSVASRWVRAEATLADRRNKLVPAIIETCDLPIIFELTHAADLADWAGDTSDPRWQTLVSDLRRLVGTNQEEAAQPEAAVPVAKPKAAPAAPVTPRPVEPLDEIVGDSIPPAISRTPAISKTPAPADDIVFGSPRLRSSGSSAKLLGPTHRELEQTKFYQRADDFDRQKAKLHCLQKSDGERFVIGPSGLKIGRTAPADVILPGAGISRAHCLVKVVDDEVLVSDLNSTNGTYVDDQRVGRVAVLPVGSILRVGDVSFEHEIRTHAEAELESAPVSFNPARNARAERLARSS